MVLAMGQPTAIGAIAAPAAVGDAPSTPCTQSGTYVTVASIAAPSSAPDADDTAITRCANRSSGSSGSLRAAPRGRTRRARSRRPAAATSAAGASAPRRGAPRRRRRGAPRRRGRGGAGGARAARDSATASTAALAIPNGRFTQKIQRHPSAWTMAPPSTGPTSPARPQTAPKRPCMRARSRTSNRSPMIVRPTGWIAPAPIPWMARHAMSASMLPANPASGRSDEEQRRAREQHRLAAVEVGELAVDGDRDRRREHVRGERPSVEREATELAHDRRHRRRDDRHLHRGEEHAEEQGDHGERPARRAMGRTVNPGPDAGQRAGLAASCDRRLTVSDRALHSRP